MTRFLSMVFSALAYAVFLVTFLYLIAFLSGHPIVPLSVDAGGADTGIFPALFIDAGLILLFGVQHSVMARPGFKRFWSKVVPAPVERSVYVLFASSALIAMFCFWRPVTVELWNFDNSVAQLLIWSIFATGWLIVLASTFLINHFELFGLQQAWLNLRGRAAAEPRFYTPLFYRFVRHPLYAGFLVAFWATPRMTLGHFFFSIGMTAYILTAIIFEERDLVDQFGDEYRAYQNRVGKLMPRSSRP